MKDEDFVKGEKVLEGEVIIPNFNVIGCKDLCVG